MRIVQSAWRKAFLIRAHGTVRMAQSAWRMALRLFALCPMPYALCALPFALPLASSGPYRASAANVTVPLGSCH